MKRKNKKVVVPLTRDDVTAILVGLTFLADTGAAVSPDLFLKLEELKASM